MPQPLSKESSREGLRPQCCRLQPLPHPVSPSPAAPGHAAHDHNYSPKRAAESLERLRAAVCNCYQTLLCQAPPRPTGPSQCLPKLGLTPKDAQLDQATSANMRLRVAVTGSTSASKRPCLGRQSPSPTSLPASPAISSTSRKFNTSGSY